MKHEVGVYLSTALERRDNAERRGIAVTFA
jgi:hypothetical protein